jgi:hypothetical protein
VHAPALREREFEDIAIEDDLRALTRVGKRDDKTLV